MVFGFCVCHFIGIGLVSVCHFPENGISISNPLPQFSYGAKEGVCATDDVGAAEGARAAEDVRATEGVRATKGSWVALGITDTESAGAVEGVRTTECVVLLRTT